MKAIHNKDYSVVKTFGSPLVHNQEAFLCPNISQTILKNKIREPKNSITHLPQWYLNYNQTYIRVHKAVFAENRWICQKQPNIRLSVNAFLMLYRGGNPGDDRGLPGADLGMLFLQISRLVLK
ncbi:hypothetical protein QGN23_14035 [Chryseobacterium gotjawalense]|uniref:Uncharacterized protein n=1 Tax=Chryseobacterium gotjawalense TaxID=3042315 RepID=A0ABY8RCE1_9FLAO|nr:hypothetical protein [Chryseobacterium sp. wdc7]WHF51526.1 hypothetical protein QGN23_14035 [Chryseobacterium sp. wdc7]